MIELINEHIDNGNDGHNNEGTGENDIYMDTRHRRESKDKREGIFNRSSYEGELIRGSSSKMKTYENINDKLNQYEIYIEEILGKYEFMVLKYEMEKLRKMELE